MGINVHYKLCHGLNRPTAMLSSVTLCSIRIPGTDFEIYPMHLPLGISQGCPVICDDAMRKVDAPAESREEACVAMDI